ncbi:MAG: VWA domain-containing protein [Gemmatimonadaceae bacterium]
MTGLPFVDMPAALIAAPLLALLAIGLLLIAVRRRAGRLERLGSRDIVARLIPPASSRPSWWRAALLGPAALCGGIAFAGPRWGSEMTVVTGSGADVVLALDASLSMLATDERPNRLERMKEEAQRFLSNAGSDRIGLIAFAGRSYILTPLTVDRGALDLFLDNLDPSVVGQAGSSLARTIRQGTDLLASTRGGGDRALVVMSDGESFEPQQDVEVAAAKAAEAGVTLITVGFGTVQGSTIPLRTPQGSTLKRDENGDIVVTRASPTMLEAAARAAKGQFIDAGATDKAARVRQALTSLRRVKRQAESGRDRQPRFQLFLIPAILLILLDTLLSERRGRRRRAPAAAVAATVLLMLIVPRVARADDAADGDRLYRAGRYRDAADAYRRAVQGGDKSPRVLYNLGTALLAAGRADDAITALQQASDVRDPELRFRALFNLGLVYLRRGLGAQGDAADQSLSSAADAYRRALRVRPTAVDAKWNYELAHRQTKSGGGGGGGGGGEQQPSPQQTPSAPRPQSGSLDRRQAEQLLSSAAREERDAQARKQKQNQPDRPPGGKDW